MPKTAILLLIKVITLKGERGALTNIYTNELSGNKGAIITSDGFELLWFGSRD